MVHTELTTKRTNSSVSTLTSRSIAACFSRLTIFNTNCSLQSIALSKSSWPLKKQPFVSKKINEAVGLKRRQVDKSDLHQRLQLKALKTTGTLEIGDSQKKRRTCLFLKGLLSHTRFLFFPPSCLFIFKPGRAAKCLRDNAVTGRTVKWCETRCSDPSKWRG